MYAPEFQLQQVDRKEGYWMCTYGAWSAQTLADPGQTHQLHTHNRRIGSDGIPKGVGGVERRGRQITAGAQTHEILHSHDTITEQSHGIRHQLEDLAFHPGDFGG